MPLVGVAQVEDPHACAAAAQTALEGTRAVSAEPV
jgi:hypothetical protein